MKRSRHIIYTLITLVGIAGAAMLPSLTSCRSCSGADDRGLSKSMDSLLTPLFPDDAPGAIAIITKGDSMIYGSTFGLADLYTGEPMSFDTKMCLASSTKTFTATALLKLHDEGKLSLDNRLIDYFPELPESVYGEVTLRHVLSQSSGIPDGRPRDKAEWERYKQKTPSIFGDGSDYTLYGREKELTRFLATVDSLDFRPGTDFVRRDPPYMLLSEVIEQASGKDFETYMREAIFEPAALASARYVPLDGDLEGMAHAYRRNSGKARPGTYISDDGRWEEFDFGEAEFFLSRADRGLFMTARDLARWEHIYNSGLLISPESTRLFGVPIVNTGTDGEGYSLGVNVSHLDDGTLKFHHSSTRGGFVAVEVLFPECDLAYIILANRNEWNYAEVAKTIDNILLTKGLLSRDD
ncbi:MAG: beta-lactamase family protein [Muribaculaceae bacterium]|nr:beta-lactamase family protein [Muribaculaceae bacterium]